MNFFCGNVIDCSSEHYCAVQLACDETHCDDTSSPIVKALFKPDTTTHKKPDKGERACIVVAPGNVLLLETPHETLDNCLQGTIMHVLPAGVNGVMRVNVMLDHYPTPVNVELTREAVATMELHDKKKVYVAFHATDAHVYT
jgi:molybdopterin-binding protein